jgi:hypothetical protein
MAIYLVIWNVVEESNLSIQEKTIKSNYNVNDIEQIVYCKYSKWNLGISLVELIIIGIGAWLSFQTSKLPSEYNESSFLAIAMYNTFMIYVLAFFIRQNSDDLSARASTILQMLVTVLIFTPLQLLMFVPKILYATGVLVEKKQIVLNKGGSKPVESSGTAGQAKGDAQIESTTRVTVSATGNNSTTVNSM